MMFMKSLRLAAGYFDEQVYFHVSRAFLHNGSDGCVEPLKKSTHSKKARIPISWKDGSPKGNRTPVTRMKTLRPNH